MRTSEISLSPHNTLPSKFYMLWIEWCPILKRYVVSFLLVLQNVILLGYKVFIEVIKLN